MIVYLGIGVIGLACLIIGDFKITQGKRIDSTTGRILGGMMLGAVLLEFIFLGMGIGEPYLPIIALIIAVVVGLATGKPIQNT